MEAFSLGIWLLGIVSALVGGVWLIVVAFRQELAWGLVILFIPIVGMVLFSINNWQRASRPFYVWAVGIMGLNLGEFLLKGRF